MVPLLIVASASQDEDLGLLKTGKRAKNKLGGGGGAPQPGGGVEVKRTEEATSGFFKLPRLLRREPLFTSFPPSLSQLPSGRAQCPPCTASGNGKGQRRKTTVVYVHICVHECVFDCTHSKLISKTCNLIFTPSVWDY